METAQSASRSVTRIWLSEHQADVNRDAERVEADEAKWQSRSDSDASRDLGRADVGRSGAERQAEERRKTAHRKRNLRTRQSTPNDSELMLRQKGSGDIIRHPPNLPLNYYPRNKRAIAKPRQLLPPGKNFWRSSAMT